jgi:hypothetical protein
MYRNDIEIILRINLAAGSAENLRTLLICFYDNGP